MIAHQVRRSIVAQKVKAKATCFSSMAIWPMLGPHITSGLYVRADPAEAKIAQELDQRHRSLRSFTLLPRGRKRGGPLEDPGEAVLVGAEQGCNARWKLCLGPMAKQWGRAEGMKSYHHD